ncbi:conserved membrane protein of unknown function(containing TPR-like domain,247-408) [Magnetospirillum sp. XM-1]|uniref:tetratricopeptide repeat protein n=1 Tax=Magnetospirillum sp. XM-1 TaxID=1663591 RepID=UPI00073E00C0|nr:hypothetical protein [Magnetospirillum sp. XM-1]CUW40526.1 conserved membrane protein of unknown function(containing TPR-like domain,247-408) [Magnetospirillum sp. XM-1]
MIGYNRFTWSRVIQELDSGAVIDWFTLRFFVVGPIGILIAAISAGFNTDSLGSGLRVLGLGMVFAGASAISGWIIGLLFGIPKSVNRDSDGGGTNGNKAISKANTNLEDISDWLTKTIVGVTLTGLFTLPSYIWQAAGKINALGFKWEAGGQLLAVSIFFYFTGGGFWTGYVGTRTLLSHMFGKFDRSLAEGQSEKVLSTELAIDTLRGGDGKTVIIAAAQSPEVAAADNVLLGLPLEKLTTPQQIAAWGVAHARANKLDEAAVALESALRSDPDNKDFARSLMAVYTAQNRMDKVNALRQQIDLPYTRMMDVLSALYEPPPGGFTEAIRLGKHLLRKIDPKNLATLNVWLACAFGQQYQYLSQRIEAERGENEARAEELAEARKNALAHVKAALEADPTTRGWLFQLWIPPEGARDQDLAVFGAFDKEFAELLDPQGARRG